MQKTNRKDVIVIMKKVLALFCVSVAIMLICIMTSTKSKLPGSWYCVSDPDEYIIIHENGQVEMSDDGTYTYEYKKGTISFIPDNEWLYNTITAEVKIKGDTMYLDFGNYTKQYCNSYDKAFEEYSKQYPEEYEADIEQEIEAEENFQQYVMTESMPQPGAVQTAVESMGYDVFEYTGRDQHLDNDPPTVVYYFDVIGNTEQIAASYEYANKAWFLSCVYEYIDEEWVTPYNSGVTADTDENIIVDNSVEDPSGNYWTQVFYVDEFGDTMDEWRISTNYCIEGTFKNLSTDNSSLLAILAYEDIDAVSITLYEYGDINKPLRNVSQENRYYKIVIKNEEGERYEARCQMLPDWGRMDILDEYTDTVFHMMQTSEMLKIYIESEDTPEIQYRFDVYMSNFNEVLEEVLA